MANTNIAGIKGIKTASIPPLVLLPVERSNRTRPAVIPVPPKKIKPSEILSVSIDDIGLNSVRLQTASFILRGTVRTK